jgi:hypothetical protein
MLSVAGVVRGPELESKGTLRSKEDTVTIREFFIREYSGIRYARAWRLTGFRLLFTAQFAGVERNVTVNNASVSGGHSENTSK